ncbi:response regulator [Solirubrobacter deserti]|uniref:Response regulator transcription factor n=1 Tax=Solirubrobacter deserti TaxID=2282478 RepID=A0ABT4RTS3_9ACTN|nr:response regulator transcription factor [Solirubrobacter deserti]MDA0141860.1 response regulator transcription factor [Solirubrobacter deserti]
MTVLVAEDHPVFREGLTRAIAQRPDLSLIAAVDDGRRALDDIHDLAPAVAVLDLGLPGLDGLTVIETIARERLATRCVVVSALDDSATVYRAIAAGARGYVPKTVASADICDAIERVARGQTVLRPEVQDGLADEIRLRRERGDEGPVLTPREAQIVRLAADGYANAEIARELHVSTATIKTHLQHIFEKLEVSDRAAAVAKAIRRGLIP